MTEKEKMLAHQMYDANYNKELHDERIAAKELCWDIISSARRTKRARERS